MKEYKRIAIFATLTILSLFSTSITFAAKTIPAEIKNYGYNFHEANNITPELATLTTELLGDRIDLSSGSVSFSQTDISIPGNSDLPVEVIRTLSDPDSWFRETREFETWSLSLPHVRSTYISTPEGDHKNAYWAIGQACSKPLNSNSIFSRYIGQDSTLHQAHPGDYWNGDTVSIPGKGSVKLTQLARDSTYKRYNNRNWKIDCISTASSHEGFKVTTDTGNVYYFTQQKIKESPSPYYLSPVITSETCYVECSEPTLPETDSEPPWEAKYKKYHIFMLVSRVEDRFGNWVDYNYDNNGNINVIESNDGRTINFTFSNGRISKITANGKDWQYIYDDNWTNTLEKVIRPDDKFWKFEHDKQSVSSFWRENNIGQHSQVPMAGSCAAVIKNQNFISITHPEGMKGEFTLAENCQGQSEVPKIRRFNRYNDSFQTYVISKESLLFSITNKTLTFKGGTTYQWNYFYSNNEGAFLGDEITERQRVSIDVANMERAHLKSTTVIRPDTSKQISYFDRRYLSTGGNLMYQETYDPSGILRQRDEFQYQDGQFHGHSQMYVNTGVTPEPVSQAYHKEYSSSQQQLLIKRVINTYSDSGLKLDDFTEEYRDFNQYDQYRLLDQYNSLGWQRKIKYAYYHDTANWLLNLPTTEQLSPDGSRWTTTSETTYYPASGVYKSLPNQSKTMGHLVTSNSEYHGDGNLKKIEYNGSNRYELFEDYKRGKPQKITLPCPASNGCDTANGSTSNTTVAKVIINHDGTTESITDFKGNKTSYQYNDIGWLTKIDPANLKWADTNIRYETVVVADGGVTASGISVGSLRQTVTRGNYEKRIYHDSLLRPVLSRVRDSSDNDSIRYQRFEYDYNNRIVLESFPASSVSSDEGIHTLFDVFGRPKTITRTSDNASTQYDYLANNKIRVTDAKKNVTTTSYLAYGSPAQSLATLIESPESVDTKINYNLFSQISSITQGTITEFRLYDSAQQLCKQVRPETGNVAFAYNEQRQLLWRAENASSDNSCDLNSVSVSEKTIFSYNNQGTISSANYPNSTPDLAYEYDDNGKLTKLTAGVTAWAYDYDSAGNLDFEELILDNQSFRLDYDYSALGHLQQITYPSQRQVNFMPNALGQSRQASIFATNASYHPNGQLKQLTYGNGVTSVISLDSSGRINQLNVNSGTTGVISLIPSYDLNDNINSMVDGIDSSYSLSSFDYDGLNRLKQVNGKWGIASYSYDELGNILTKSKNGTVLTYHYDQSKNLLGSVSGAYHYNFSYDDRGNVTDNDRFSLDFNRANQLISANGNSYLYDGNNRRVKHTGTDGQVKYSVYSQGGQLMYQLDTSSGKATDHIYLAGKLIAKISNGLSMPELNVPAISTDGALAVSWSTVTGTNTYELDEQKDDGSWISKYKGTATQWNVSGYDNGSYRYRVRACGKRGCSSYKNSNVVTVLFPPQQPASISVPNSTDIDGAYTVSWAASDTATSYILKQSIDEGSWTTVNSSGVISLAISGKGTGSYRYAVKACNSSGCSSYHYSNAFSVLLPPPIPASISTPTGTDADGAYTVSWAATSTATSYILRQSVNGGNWTTVTNPTSTSQAISGKGTASYRYAVKACNSSGCSDYRYSVTFSVLLPPPVPTSISTPTGKDTDGAYTVSWATSNTAASYTLRQSINGGSWTTVSSPTSTSQVISGKGNATYRYAVRACNNSGCSCYRYSASFSVLLPPPVPSSASVPASDYDGGFTISWSSTHTATYYVLLERVNGGSWSTVNANLTTTSYVRSGRGSATYQYAIKACNSSGCSSYRHSGNLINTLMPSSAAVPSTDHDGSYTISWGSVSTRTRYILQEKAGSGSWVTLTSTMTGTSYTRTGRGNTSYQYRVAACNAHGCGGYRHSGAVAVTLPPSSITYSTKDHDGAYSLSWANVTTATSYQLQQQLSSGSWSTVYSGSGTATTLSGRRNGYYKYRIKACRNNSCSGYRTGGTIWVIRPNLTMSWNEASVTYVGDNATLRWDARGADYCRSNYNNHYTPPSGNLPPSGSQSVPIFATTTATITCYFSNQDIAKSRLITVDNNEIGGGGFF